jgi:hypothetical protein
MGGIEAPFYRAAYGARFFAAQSRQFPSSLGLLPSDFGEAVRLQSLLVDALGGLSHLSSKFTCLVQYAAVWPSDVRA